MSKPFSPGSGFTDPVFGAQSVFRVMLDVMSRPGLIACVPETGVRGPEALPPALLAVLLAVCDHEAPVWLDADLRKTFVPQWLAFHSSAPVVEDPMRASFGVIRPDASPPQFESFAAGDPRYPDRSTTLIVLCDSFVGGEALTLEGPGIETSVRIAPSGVPATFIDQAVDNHTLYPCGLDVLLLAGRELVGLPRSTRIIRGTR